MNSKKNWLCFLVAFGSLLILVTGCGDHDVITGLPDSGSNVGGAAGGDEDAGDSNGGAGSALLLAPAAVQVASIELEEPLADVVYAEDLALGLHEESGVSILDMSNPTDPRVISTLQTTGRAIAVALNVKLRILFIVTVSGELRAYRVGDVENPVMAASSIIVEPGVGVNPIRGMVRVQDRLYLLGQAHLLPASIVLGNNGSIGLLAETEISLEEGASDITASGGRLYVAFSGGRVQTWGAGATPTLIGETNLGGEIVGWVARGNRLLVALSGLGLRVLSFDRPDAPAMVFDAPEFDDLEGLERFGSMVIVSLSRGLLVALDLSDFSAPRSLVTKSGALPRWIAPIGGNLVLGGGTSLSIFGVPPFVSASVPHLSRAAFPRYGKIPLQLSKAVNPVTATIDNVVLSCNGTPIAGSVVVSADNLKITFVPNETLPAGVTCSLAFPGVEDSLGLPLTSGADVVQFETLAAVPAPIENPHSSYAHTADGAFTDWQAGLTENFEYFDVTPARGMYSYFYADFDGEKLWLLNDWFYNGDSIDPDCYNQFGVWTGNGSQSWDIRAYGDQRIEVRLNGTLLEEGDERVAGGYQHTATPNDSAPHTIYEIAIETEPGSWGVQLHDPGPTFSCQNLETDPTNYNGSNTADTTTIDATQRAVLPSQPIPSIDTVATTTPTLTWSLGGEGGGQFTTYVFVLSNGDDMSQVFYRTIVYGQQIELPLGLLKEGGTYTWQVIAYNLAGSASSAPVTFTVGEIVDPGAPKLVSVDPASAVQGSSPTLTINGSGFVEGARVFLGNSIVSTTFISSTQLTAMLTEALTAQVGSYELTVRNNPDDVDSASGGLVFVVTEAASTLVALTGISPNQVVANTQIPITASMLNAPLTGTYVLHAILDGGGDEYTSNCISQEANSCSAALPGLPAGSYDVWINVTIGADAPYDTNQVTLTVSPPVTACVHDECLPGARLGNTCSTCATAVCTAIPACCTTSWTADCVAFADASGSCACNAPSLVSLTPDTQESGDSTQVTVDLNDAPAGPSYALQLPPAAGGGDGSIFNCVRQQNGDCIATVTGDPIGVYDAYIRVQNDDVEYFTNTLQDEFTVTEAASTVVTLGSIIPNQAVANTQIPNIAVSLLNAPMAGTYVLHARLDGGGEDYTGNCISQEANSCSAALPGLPAGSYDVWVNVTIGADAPYDTNEVTLTVSPPVAACVHSECLPGASLGSACSTCATAVCTAIPACCTTSWTADCVAFANTSGSCACNAPSLVSLTPDTQESGDSTQVTVDLNDAPAGPSYALQLPPAAGGGDGSIFNCVRQQNGDCIATVTGDPVGVYDAYIRVQNDDVEYFTNTLQDEFTVTEAPAPVCFAGGITVNPENLGTCANPYLIDLSALALGSVRVHTPPAGFSAQAFGVGNASCGWTGTQQHVIYRVLLPAGAGYEVSVDAAFDYNPKVALIEDSSCDQPTTCVDEAGAGECEFAQATSGSFAGTSPFFVVGTDDDGNSLTVRVRSITPPDGG